MPNGDQTVIKAPIEVVVWHDASKTFRERYSPGSLYLITVGFMLYEDRREVVLFHEIQKSVGYASGNVDATAIPKRCIVERHKTGEFVFIPGPLVKKLREKKGVEVRGEVRPDQVGAEAQGGGTGERVPKG